MKNLFNTAANRELTIGFMGVHNSFSEKASKAFVEKQGLNVDIEKDLMPLVNAYHVKDALLENKIDLGVVAVRNSITGMVAETKEAFADMDIEIVDDFALSIHQCLFKLPEVAVEDITAVASHPQALMQTKNNRTQLIGEKTEIIMEDTSLSARMLAEGKFAKETAVVCSMEAGLMNGLELIKENMEDRKDNKTFFILVRLPEAVAFAA